MTTHETGHPREVGHDDEDYGVDSEGDEVATDAEEDTELLDRDYGDAAEAGYEEEVAAADDAGDDDSDDSTTDADDDESVLLTESEPGSVLPPEDEDRDDRDEDVEARGEGDVDEGIAERDFEPVSETEAVPMPPVSATEPDPPTETGYAAKDETETFAATTDTDTDTGTGYADTDTGTRYDTPTETGFDTEAEAVEADEAIEPERGDIAEPDTDTAVAAATAAGATPEPVGTDMALLADPAGYQERWSAIQASFVDEPRSAVESAGDLVAEVWSEIERAFAEQRQSLDARWQQGNEASTEDLRVVFREYRTLFTRLTSS